MRPERMAILLVASLVSLVDAASIRPRHQELHAKRQQDIAATLDRDSPSKNSPSASMSPLAKSQLSSTALESKPQTSSISEFKSIAPNSNQWAVTYIPYAADGSCKAADEVASDIAAIALKGFTTVRLYATDCSGLQVIGSASEAHDLKMITGIYVGDDGIGTGTEEQIADLIEWGSGRWDLVEMVVAGNEAVFNEYLTAVQLAEFVRETRERLRMAGYSGPVTTAEPLVMIQENSALICEVVDVVAANIQPFFNAALTAERAGRFVASQLGDLARCCGHEKEAYNLETGWPTQGSPNGGALPGYAQQAIAIGSILLEAGRNSVISSYTDDAWKSPGELGIEQAWGVSELFQGQVS
ncbi:hypothetical protein MBLNU230_g4397t1 [Neophaeotheca triangularis]